MSFTFKETKLKHLENVIEDLWGAEYLDKKKFPLMTKYGEIQGTYLNISHDGYDRDGPQSNLYDFTVWCENKNQHYHREYWFHGKDREQFYLQYSSQNDNDNNSYCEKKEEFRFITEQDDTSDNDEEDDTSNNDADMVQKIKNIENNNNVMTIKSWDD